MHKGWQFRHVCIVVKDMDKAIERYQSLDVGPFPPMLGGPQGTPVTGKTVRGQPSDYDMDLRVAQGGIDGLGFELIQPLKGESIYREFLEKNGEGVHHICFVVEDLDKETAEMARRGFNVIQTGATPRVKFAYFDTDKLGGCVIELAQRL